MSCPTCDHTMQNVALTHGAKVHWCPRCGTLRTTTGLHVNDELPMLVGRCRRFRENNGTIFAHVPSLSDSWLSTGIDETVNKPGTD